MITIKQNDRCVQGVQHFTGSYLTLQSAYKRRIVREDALARRIRFNYLAGRFLAWAGTSVLSILTGLGLGCLAGAGGPLQFIGIVALSVFGVWGLNYLLTRH